MTARDVRPAFRGFPVEALQFYERLAQDNSRAFWQANRTVYDESVRAPMAAMLEALADWGPFHIFRPYNDVRFAKNRPPYKEHIAGVSESEGGASYYVQLSADGLMAGSGYYSLATDQLERFRAAVVDDHRGRELELIVAALQAARLSIGSMSELKTAPRGYSRDHPRIGLLRRRGLIAYRSWPVAGWLHTPKAIDRVRETWDAAGELNHWLDAHVGPSQLPPEDAQWR